MMNGTEMMECMEAMGAMGMWPMGWIMGLFWILLFGLLIWGLYRLFTAVGTTTDAPTASRETPLETLQRRYAEGALSTEEYEERKEVLSS